MAAPTEPAALEAATIAAADLAPCFCDGSRSILATPGLETPDPAKPDPAAMGPATPHPAPPIPPGRGAASKPAWGSSTARFSRSFRGAVSRRFAGLASSRIVALFKPVGQVAQCIGSRPHGRNRLAPHLRNHRVIHIRNSVAQFHLDQLNRLVNALTDGDPTPLEVLFVLIAELPY